MSLLNSTILLYVGAKQSNLASPYQNRFPDSVPLRKQEAIFLANGKHGSEVTSLLTLAWATRQVLTFAPCIVLGDFNEGLLAKLDSRLVSLMSQYGFSQLVQTLITDRPCLL